MVDFCSKYYKIRPTKDRGHDPSDKKKFNIKQEKNDIVNHTLDEISPDKNNKFSDE